MTFDCLNNINSPLNSSYTGNYRHKLSQKQGVSNPHGNQHALTYS